MKQNVLLVGQMMPHIMAALDAAYDVHRLYEAGDRDAFLGETGGSIRGIATPGQADRSIMDACPDVEIISSFGVGYDGIDAQYAKDRGTSVSELVQSYLDAVSRPLKAVEDPPVLREIRGILRKGDRDDYRQHLIEKYR